MGGYFRNLPNPYAVASAEPVLVAVQLLALACGLGALVAAVAGMVLRWKRADHVGRQQLKWFFAALPVTAAAWIVDVVALGPDSQAATQAALVLGSLAGVLLPVAIGVAVLRYRLYEIDILLNRAVLYGSLSAVVAAVYLSVVAVARWGFGDRGLAVQVLATVVAAAGPGAAPGGSVVLR